MQQLWDPPFEFDICSSALTTVCSLVVIVISRTSVRYNQTMIPQKTYAGELWPWTTRIPDHLAAINPIGPVFLMYHTGSTLLLLVCSLVQMPAGKQQDPCACRPRSLGAIASSGDHTDAGRVAGKRKAAGGPCDFGGLAARVSHQPWEEHCPQPLRPDDRQDYTYSSEQFCFCIAAVNPTMSSSDDQHLSKALNLSRARLLVYSFVEVHTCGAPQQQQPRPQAPQRGPRQQQPPDAVHGDHEEVGDQH